MYSEKLKKLKIEGNSAVEVRRFNREKIFSLLNGFCKPEDILGVPQKKFFELFDQYCEEIKAPKIAHKTVGRVIREKYGYTRAEMRTENGVTWVYVKEEN